MNDLLIERVRNNRKVHTLLRKADKYLEGIGYTEHGLRHAGIAAERARMVLSSLEYPSRLSELAWIVGYLHDTGNFLGRNGHGMAGALLSKDILVEVGLDIEEILTVMGAISNHEEESGSITDEVVAALILGDKTDVHRSRVRQTDFIATDIHDRVNYAVTESDLSVDKDNMSIILKLKIDVNISQVMEYFEIFLTRILMCKRSAEFLKCKFGLLINGVKLL